MNLQNVIQSKVPLDLAKKTLLNILFTSNLVTEKFKLFLKPYDISGEQYNVLRILKGQKGKPVNMFTIQERMIAKTSNTTRLVDKLLLKNLVTRNVCPSNRRKIEVAITEKGLELLNTLDPLVQEKEDLFAENLTQVELETLNNLLEKYCN